MALAHRGRRPSRLTGLAAVCGVLVLLTACQSSSQRVSTAAENGPVAPVAKPVVSVSPGPKADDVAPTQKVTVDVEHGTLASVTATPHGSDGPGLEGTRSDDGTSWSSTGTLEFGTTYDVQVQAKDEAGKKVTRSSRFTTLTPDDTVRARVAPLDGETVGVGMPIAVYFTAPVENKAAVEKRLEVETSTPVEGSWYWMDDEEVHFRPREYWPAGTDVTLRIPLAGVDAGNGVWGDEDREIGFHIGDSIVSTVDVNAHTMTVRRNGDVLREIPVTTGKNGFLTRGGTKVVLAKQRHKKMDAATIGIAKDDPEYYNLDVEYAVRVTWSGEFLHAAPWSTGSQGSDNVSHGCVGMTPEKAAWFYDLATRGDVVEVKGSPKPMELRNGYGDWNLSWDEWQDGSALH